MAMFANGGKINEAAREHNYIVYRPNHSAKPADAVNAYEMRHLIGC